MAKSIVLVLVLVLQSCQQMSSLQTQSHTWQEAFEALGISYNPDGTLNRSIQIPMVDPSPYEADPSSALSQDIYISAYNKASVRVYIPATLPKNKKKLPLIIYLHGGDFVLYSASTVVFHNFCIEIATRLPAVVVSVEYRLAPEHRLPAAFDDALNALFWLQNQSLGIGIGGRDPWLDHADFSRAFLLGSSAGANIAYHTLLRALDFDLQPLEIKGLLLNQAFFGGLKRTKSEIRLIDDPNVPLYVSDVLWTLALPKRANRDHEFCNPISGGTYLGRVYELPKVYIKGDYGDPLVGRSVQLANYMESRKVAVTRRFNNGGYHGIELLNKTAAKQLYRDIKYFVDNLYLSPNSEDLSHHDHAQY